MSKPNKRPVHVAEIKKTYKGKVHVSTYLRRTFRQDGKVKHETVANISDLPDDLLAVIKNRLATGRPLVGDGGTMKIHRSIPHGNVAAVLGTMRNIGLDQFIAARPCRERSLVMAMIADRIISPGSKLSCATGMHPETVQNTLAQELQLGEVDVHELYDAMDWLLERQTRIENKLAKTHLKDGTLILFDVSSSFYTGKKSDLITHGYSRDHRSDRPQIVYGLLCDSEGRPIAVEVFPGNTADPNAFTSIVAQVRKRFGITNLVFAGDRGMITSKRIDEDLRDVEGLEWISALRSDGIRSLVDAGKIDRSLLDEKDLAEITDEDNFPGERLIVCRNPLLADKRARKREELLKATEKDLDKVVAATQRKSNPLHGEKEIGIAVGQVIGKHKMKKHIDLTITENSFTYARRTDNIAAEAALDGLYVIRTCVMKERMKSESVVLNYKSLAKVERAFRSVKSIDLHIRPIRHWNDDRIRAHVFLCMLAYYVEWHMRDALRELIFDDEDIAGAQATRKSVVAPAKRSKSAKKKDATRRTPDDFPVQSFQDLLKDMATLVRNVIHFESSASEFHQLTESTTLQRRVFDLLSTHA